MSEPHYRGVMEEPGTCVALANPVNLFGTQFSPTAKWDQPSSSAVHTRLLRGPEKRGAVPTHPLPQTTTALITSPSSDPPQTSPVFWCSLNMVIT